MSSSATGFSITTALGCNKRSLSTARVIQRRTATRRCFRQPPGKRRLGKVARRDRDLAIVNSYFPKPHIISGTLFALLEAVLYNAKQMLMDVSQVFSISSSRNG